MSQQKTIDVVQKYMLERMQTVKNAFSTNDKKAQAAAAEHIKATADIQLLLLQETYEKNT